VGVAIAVILMAIAAWIFARRRRRWSKKNRSSSGNLNSQGDIPDEEIVRKVSDSQIYAYRASGAGDVGNVNELESSEKERIELASPVVPVEVVGDREFAAELQGSSVSAQGGQKGTDERLFSDPPIDDVDEPGDARPRIVDKKG